jgi:hypothetical protein
MRGILHVRQQQRNRPCYNYGMPSRLRTDPFRFYVYALARPDGSYFYIGKGSGRRVQDHEKHARAGDVGLKNHIIRKIWRDGGSVGRVMLATEVTMERANAIEAEWISRLGRIDLGNGCLANHTTGGDSRHTHDMTTREILSVKAKAQMTPEAREWLRQKTLAQFADPGAREKASQGCRAAATQELRDIRRQRAKIQFASSDARQFLSDVSRAFNSTPEAKAANSAEMRAQWADPEWRAKVIAAQNKGKAIARSRRPWWR